MAPKTASQQTSRVLNVSQNHESSPAIAESQQGAPIATHQLAAGSAETEIVEDSYKHLDDEPIPRGGAVQSPNHAAAREAFDEDYDATPPKSSQQSKLNGRPFKKVSAAQSRLDRSVASHHHYTEAKASATALTTTKPAPARTSVTARTPSNLKSVAQIALIEESQQSSTKQVGRATRQSVRRSSDKSRASTVTSQAPIADPQTGAMTGAGQAGSRKLKMPSKPRTSAAAQLKAKQQGRSRDTPLDLIDDGECLKPGPAKTSAKLTPPEEQEEDDDDYVPPCAAARSKGKAPARGKAGAQAGQSQSQLVASENNISEQISQPVKSPPGSPPRKTKSAAAATSKSRTKPAPSAATHTASQAKTQSALVAVDDDDLNGEPLSQASPKEHSKHVKQPSPRKVATKNGRSDSSYDSPEAQTARQAKSTKAVRKASPGKEPRKSARLTKGDNISKSQPVQPDEAEPRSSRPATGIKVPGAKKSKPPNRVVQAAKKASVQEESQDSQPVRVPGRRDISERARGTQDDPEVLSDTHVSSPYSELQGGHPEEALQRRTPAAKLPSSPPTALRTAHSLSTAARSRKTTVINFGTYGPRNQGALPSNTPASKFASGSRSPKKIPLVEAHTSKADTGRPSTDLVRGGIGKTPGSKAKLQARHKPAQSSFKASGKPPFEPAPSSNVADSFDAALAGFFSSRVAKSKALSTELREDTQRPLDAEDEQIADDFFGIEHNTQLFDSDVDIRTGIAHEEETATGSMVQDDSARGVTSSHTVVAQRDAAKSPSPPPPAGKVRSSEQQPCANVIVRSARDQDAAVKASTKGKSPVKRARSPTSDEEMPPPSSRPARNDHTRGVGSPAVKRRHVEEFRETAAKSRPKRKIATDDVDKHSPKRVKAASNTIQPVLPTSQRQLKREQPGRTSQRVGPARNDTSLRRASQCSQTVDVNGSPAPPDMQLRETETVLENFSQQTHLASDDDEVASPYQGPEPTPYHDRRDPSRNAYALAPSHRPKKPAEALSSNAKPVPAPPQANSNAIERVHVTEKEQCKFLEKHDHKLRLHDPFNDLQVLRGPPKQPMQQNSALPPDVAQREYEQQSAHDKPSPAMAKISPLKRVQVDSPPQNSSTTRATRARARQLPDQESQKFAVAAGISKAANHGVLRQDIEQELGRFREIEAHVASEEEEDIEQTLVEHQHAVFKRQKPLVDQGSASEASLDGPTLTEWEDPMLDDYNFDDPLKFAKSLKPHQLDLFDELQRCVQRLTMYMVQTENNTERMLEQYHSRNKRMIERAREKQAEHLQQLRDEVNSKKQEKLRELEQWRVKLGGWSRAVEQQREQQKAQEKKQKTYNQDLAFFIDQL